jgi:hypothetical protein
MLLGCLLRCFEHHNRTGCTSTPCFDILKWTGNMSRESLSKPWTSGSTGRTIAAKSNQKRLLGPTASLAMGSVGIGLSYNSIDIGIGFELALASSTSLQVDTHKPGQCVPISVRENIRAFHCINTSGLSCTIEPYGPNQAHELDPHGGNSHCNPHACWNG